MDTKMALKLFTAGLKLAKTPHASTKHVDGVGGWRGSVG